MSANETAKSPRYLQEIVADYQKFQKFICNVLEENGVMCDLRAYLRQHIISVLNNAKTGVTPPCQKHFTQRLELPVQAVNILMAEYLLRSDFRYTLSVFIAEMPLANMVFDFAKNLLEGRTKPTELRFTNKDIKAILNYLGIKCDSTFVQNILDSYKDNASPLLICILKNLQVFRDSQEDGMMTDAASNGLPSLQSELFSNRSSKMPTADCQHCEVCKECHSKVSYWKEKYVKARHRIKNSASCDSMKVQEFLDSVDNVENNVIDEMFEEVKEVYETEMARLREELERQQHNAAMDREALALALRQEMEESLKAREEELSRNVLAKKKFLWELAQSLRAQHERVARAVRIVTHKEETLKSQLSHTDSVLKSRGENIRNKLSDKLSIVEGQLDSEKRDANSLCENNSCCEISSQYNLLRKELSVLRKYIETIRSEPKCLMERSTITDMNLNCVESAEGLNNKQDVRIMKEDDRIKNSQVINDFKKQKNVNFSAELTSVISNPEDKTPCSPDSGRECDVITQLTQENERLREYAAQQEQQMQTLSQSSAALRAELSFARDLQPRNAPTAHNAVPVSASCKGAGEQLSLYVPCAQRELLPGDPVPFIGLLTDKHSCKRVLSQCKRMRNTSPHARRSTTGEADARPHNEAGPSYQVARSEITNSQPSDDRALHVKMKKGPFMVTVDRTKSAKSVIREAKLKLRTHARIKLTEQRASSSREKSPATVLREAKLRLRKLEIEAQAVEQSYIDYKNRKNKSQESALTKDSGEHATSATQHAPDSKHPSYRNISLANADLEKFLSHTISKLSDAKFSNKNSALHKAKPIPTPFCENERDFLNTPLPEFRKYYLPSSERPRYNDSHKETNYIQETNINKQLKFKSTTPPHKLTSPEPEALSEKINNTSDVITQNDNGKTCTFNLDAQNDEPHLVSEKSDDNGKTRTFNLDAQNKSHLVNENSDTFQKEPINVLRIEVEPTEGLGVINVESESKQENLVVMVQSKVDNELIQNNFTQNGDNLKSCNTFVISESSGLISKEMDDRSVSAEQEKLSQNNVLKAIFHKDNVMIHSSSEIRELSIKNVDDSLDSNKENETYMDDFSADVDNYNNSRSSPISLPVSAPDETFWNDD